MRKSSLLTTFPNNVDIILKDTFFIRHFKQIADIEGEKPVLRALPRRRRTRMTQQLSDAVLQEMNTSLEFGKATRVQAKSLD